MYQYKYCSNCGELFDKKSDIFFVCPKCDFRIFVSPKPSVGVILFDSDNRILFTKRNYEPGKGLWGIPGGFIDPDETAKQALIREVREELGLNIETFEYFGSYTGNYLHKGVNYKVVNAIFTAKMPINKTIKLSEESSEFKFFEIENIPVDLLAPEDLKKAIVELIESKHH